MGYGSTSAIAGNVDNSSGVARAWGTNEGYQLGNPSANPFSNASSVNVQSDSGDLQGVVALFSSSGSDACAAIQDPPDGQNFRCWGTDNYGEIGTTCSGSIETASATEIPNDAFADPPTDTLLARGDDFGCAVKRHDNTNIYCWGDLTYGGHECTLKPQSLPW